MKIVVKHSCGHYQLHEINVKNDSEAAQVEAALQKEVCKDCQAADKINPPPATIREKDL
jgi:hypothetical protein